jgi:cellulose biosynthesis protein BcsQ
MSIRTQAGNRIRVAAMEADNSLWESFDRRGAERMADGEDQLGGTLHPDELAKDVARLYSWANIEDSSYRSFSTRKQMRSSAPIEKTEKPDQSKDKGPAGRPPAHSNGDVAPAAKAEQSPAIQELAALEPPAPELPSPELMTPVLPPPASPRSRKARPVPDERTDAAVPDHYLTSQPPGRTSAMAIYSLAGGVGKTTICANLGRILCSMGKSVLLVDAAGSGILPFYFGASDLRPGMRTFAAPSGNSAPIQIFEAEDMAGEWLENTVKPAMQTVQRTIFDVGPASISRLPQILSLCDVLLVPLLSDLNSIFSTSRIEAAISAMQRRGVHASSPFYIFNLFDEDNSRDRQARELVARQCGDRLLPLTICQSREIGDAIAERMTVADHAPESEVAHQYLRLAMWLRKVAPTAPAVQAAGRWSER